MNLLKVYVGTTHFKFRVTRSGILDNGASIRDILSQFLSFNFDPRFKHWVLHRRYYHYDEATQMIHLPRYALDHIRKEMLQIGIDLDIEHMVPTPYKKVDIKINSKKFTPRANQVGAISYLSKTDEEHPIRGIALQTGQGKTFSLNCVIAELGRRSIIYVEGLTEQWRKAILDQTTLTDKDIYVIKGAHGVAKLVWGIDKKLHPKVIIASISTMRAYAKGGGLYESLPSFDKFHEICKIGVRVVDEVHLNYYANLMVDLRSNIADTLVSTATFSRTNETERRLFDMTYPVEIRYGHGVYKKYVNIYDYTYRLGYGVSQYMFQSSEGYSHPKYENWLLQKKSRFSQIFLNVYWPILQSNYLNVRREGQKCLILVSTTRFAEELRKALIPLVPELLVNVYIYVSAEDVLFTSDIIISTPQSAGTGRDIPNLKTEICTVARSSQNDNEQMLGRLRELADDTPNFAFTSDLDVRKHMDYRTTRRALFMPRAKQYFEFSL